MSTKGNIVRGIAVLAAVVAMFLVFGASGARAVPAHAVAASGSLAAEETPDTSDEDSSDEEDSTDDPEDSSDEEDSDDEDSDDEDSESDEPTDEPTDESTFPATPSADATDDIAEMPTQDAGASTTEESASPLGWVLLGAGVLTALAAVLVYRRNRHLM